MSNKSILIPSFEDASEFIETVNKSINKINQLKRLSGINPIDYEADNDVLSHVFYKWVTATQNFKRAIQYLDKKKLMTENSVFTSALVAKCVAVVYMQYDFYVTYPKKLIRTTKATGEKASRHINELLALLDMDLQMESYTDSNLLKELLQKMDSELKGELPITYQRSKRADLLSVKLVLNMHEILKIQIGSESKFVISELVSIMHEVPKHQVRRYIKNK